MVCNHRLFYLQCLWFSHENSACFVLKTNTCGLFHFCFFYQSKIFKTIAMHSIQELVGVWTGILKLHFLGFLLRSVMHPPPPAHLHILISLMHSKGHRSEFLLPLFHGWYGSSWLPGLIKELTVSPHAKAWNLNSF